MAAGGSAAAEGFSVAAEAFSPLVMPSVVVEDSAAAGASGAAQSRPLGRSTGAEGASTGGSSLGDSVRCATLRNARKASVTRLPWLGFHHMFVMRSITEKFCGLLCLSCFRRFSRMISRKYVFNSAEITCSEAYLRTSATGQGNEMEHRSKRQSSARSVRGGWKE